MTAHKSDTWSASNLIHDTSTELVLGHDGRIEALKYTQEIPDDFLDELAAIRDIQDNNALGNYALAARIPTVLVEKWMREGFNIFDKNIGVADIIKKLESLDLQKLRATNKRLY